MKHESQVPVPYIYWDLGLTRSMSVAEGAASSPESQSLIYMTYWRLADEALTAQETFRAAMHDRLMAMMGRMERCSRRWG